MLRIGMLQLKKLSSPRRDADRELNGTPATGCIKMIVHPWDKAFFRGTCPILPKSSESQLHAQSGAAPLWMTT